MHKASLQREMHPLQRGSEKQKNCHRKTCMTELKSTVVIQCLPQSMGTMEHHLQLWPLQNWLKKRC